MNKQILRLIDLLYVIVLGVYIVAGVPFAPFHGDESMQIYMSRDFTIAFLDGRLGDLVTQPPYEIDSDAHLRLINGTVNRYTIGAAWRLAGYTANDLPPRPGWDWGLNYQQNVETNHRSGEGALNAARLPSAVFTALSVGIVFLLGSRLGGRPTAYIAAAIYALNPAILLNGRRALQEGSMLFFGLLTILVAVWMSRRDRKPIWSWGMLIGAGALTLASKHSGVVFVAGALGWLGISAAIRQMKPLTPPPTPPRIQGEEKKAASTPEKPPHPPTPSPKRGEGEIRRLVVTIGALIVSGLLMVGAFIALSPALWNDPPARVVNLLEERTRLLDIQVSIDPLAPLTLLQRLEAIVLQPTINPVMYYELGSWTEAEPIRVEIERYGLWHGYPDGVFGVLIMLAAGAGIVVAGWRWWRYAGLLMWLGLTVISLLVNPLPWQRYYLPLIPVVALLAGLGIQGILKRLTLENT